MQVWVCNKWVCSKSDAEGVESLVTGTSVVTAESKDEALDYMTRCLAKEGLTPEEPLTLHHIPLDIINCTTIRHDGG